MDFGTVRVWLGARVPRVCCAEHGVLTTAVPWAKHGSHFTLDFAYVEWANDALDAVRIDAWRRALEEWKSITMISLVMLFCSNIRIPCPSSNAPMTINKGLIAQKVA